MSGTSNVSHYMYAPHQYSARKTEVMETGALLYTDTHIESCKNLYRGMKSGEHWKEEDET